VQEVEDAHNQWLAEQQATAKKKQEDDAAHNTDVGSSMRMIPEDE